MRDPGLRENRRAEIQVGIIVLFSVVVLILGIFWLSEADLGRGIRLHGVAADAGQMTAGARVFLRGVDVGSVSGLELQEGRVVVTMRVTVPGALPADTRGFILASGFIGNQMVRLLPGTAERALAEGDTIALERVPDLQAMAADLGEQASTVVERAGDVLSPETAEELRAGSNALAGAMRELQGLVREQRGTLDELLRSLNETSRNLARATDGPELERTAARLDSLSERLVRAGSGLDSSSHALASILAKVDEGQGSLGLLVNDRALYERVTAAMENLQAASEEIALLTKDVRERPERYLRGVRFSVF